MTVAEDTACHEGRIDLEPACNEGAPAGVGELSAEFVQYPGCQQLQVWLPQDGYSGYTDWRRVDADGVVAEQGPVRNMLSGSVQMLFDTLAWPQGTWRLEVGHQAGWKHVLPMVKQPEGAPAKAPEPAQPPVATGSGNAAGESRVYRDGGGRVIVDEEQLFRERAHAKLLDAFTRKVRYEGHGRAGTYTWTEGDLRIRFDQEMAAGRCKAIVLVPGSDRWEAATGAPLARRDEILQSVAEQARQDFGSRFEIGDGSIEVY